MSLSPSEAAKIGFNESVVALGRTLHVQTEVLTRDGIVIRTVVLDGGVAVFAERQPCPPDVTDLGAFTALVEAQHQRRIERLRREGLASK